MEEIAKSSGWGRLYEVSPSFRERFAEMLLAIEKLPPDLLPRGKTYEYPQLHHACVAGDIEVVKALLESGIPADAYTYTDDESDVPPLVWLAQDQDMDAQGKIQMAQLLITYGADVDEGEPLQAALDHDDEDFEAFLLAAGASD